jgi:hypothetical protein
MYPFVPYFKEKISATFTYENLSFLTLHKT